MRREAIRTVNKDFKLVVQTPAGFPNPSLAIAACRAGGLGVLDLEYTREQEVALDAMQRLARYVRNDFGIKVDGDDIEFLSALTSNLPEHLKVVIITFSDPQRLKEEVRTLHEKGLSVILESIFLDQAKVGEEIGVDAVIAKGNESGGRVGNKTTFILLQQFLRHLSVPVWAQGGIGLHTAAACFAAGTAAVILDIQLALTRESPLPEPVKTKIRMMDGSETFCLGGEIGESYRVCSRLGSPVVDELRQKEKTLAYGNSLQGEIAAKWRKEISRCVGWDSLEQHLYLLGQDVAFAAQLAQRYVTVGGVLEAIRQAIDSHCQVAWRLHSHSEDLPLARSHGTRYPIVQGPMARVSDVPPFARQVAEEGALPFIAVAWLHGQELEELLKETHDQLQDCPWGVGLLGFIPSDLYNEQLNIINKYRPSFALIAGGRPDQVRTLEQDGIPTYVHVPSPALLRMFLENGVRRLVFEGRESGGHIGPRCGFVLWETMIDTLIDSLPSNSLPEEYHVLLAGGIHDALSASMVAVMAAPLAERGVRVGVQLGSAYLFTREALDTGAIVERYQQEALNCDQTTILETGPGHGIRCVYTPYAKTFKQEKQRLSSEGKSSDEIQNILERMSLGRIRLAAKGITRNPDYGQDPAASRFVTLSEEEQHAQGMYMIGQLAALRDQALSIGELHRDIVVGCSERIEALHEKHMRLPSPKSSEEERPSDIAIIGMACLLPESPALQAYWENILNKFNAIKEVPEDRWDSSLYYDPDRKTKDKVYSKWGAFLDDVPFDPLRYGMPPNSLYSIEPIQLLTLEAVGMALEDAGYSKRPFPRKQTSVILGISGVADLGQLYGFRSALPAFFGSSSREILSHFDGVLPEWTEDSFPGILMNVTAGRVANRFDLGGSNFTVDGACASSLAALYIAARELETQNSDLVIVGGADTMQNPFTYLCFSKTLALSPRGRCCPLDESADGIVIGEGIGVAILKRLADAERDGDRIYAVIKGIGTSSDGRDKSLTAPLLEGQLRALQRAYAKANISPATVGLIEAHATGTAVGDQVEIEALTQMFNTTRVGPQICAIGSVKSMIGHTKATAGLAGLIKVALALYHKVLPPTLGVETPNSRLRSSESPLYVNTETRPWIHHSTEHPRRAGVSAFGFGGTNFHAVLEEYTQDFLNPSTQSVFQQWPSELFILRENSRQALIEKIQSLIKMLSQRAEHALGGLAFAINKINEQTITEKDDSSLRLSLVATSLDDLKNKLVLSGKLLNNSNSVIHDPRGIYFSERPLGREGKLAFLFPGQGSHYLNMLCDLAIQFPEVRDVFERSDRILKDTLPQPLSAFIFPPPAFTEEERPGAQRSLTQTHIAQPAVGTASLAMLHLLEALGILPDMVAGHSYGEYVALCAAGVLSEDDLVVLSEARGRFIIEAASPEPGIMAAVNSGACEVSETIRDIQGVVVANLNAPEQTIISGESSSVEEAIERFKSLGIQARSIPVACAFHSPLVAQACERLRDFLSNLTLRAPRLTVFSNSTAGPYPGEPEIIAEQLVQHLVSRVEFIREIEAMYEHGARIFVEVGPGRVLSGLVDQILGNRPHLAVTSNQAGRSELVQLHHLLGQLAAHGVPIKMDRLYEGRSFNEADYKRLTEGTREANLSPSTWMVNGARAKPPAQVSSHDADETITPTEPETAVEKDTPIAAESEQEHIPASDPLTSQTKAEAFPPTTESSPRGIRASAVKSPAGDEVIQTMKRFQQMMNRFLETQKSAMLAYLQKTTCGGGPPDQQQQDLKPTQERLKTSLQQNFPIPQIKNLHLRTAQEPSPEHPPAGPPKTQEEREPVSGIRSPEAKADFFEKELASQLYKIISERTGYPQNMLNQDQDLEADLGIDSIKRVEILGSFLQSTTSSYRQEIEKEMEKLTSIKTLRGIIQWLLERRCSETNNAPRASRCETHELTIPEGGEPGSEQDLMIQRFSLVAEPIPSPKSFSTLPVNGVLVITDDERGIARILSKELEGRGYTVAIAQFEAHTGEVEHGCYKAALDTQEGTARLLEIIRQRQGRIGGLIHLLPLKNWPPSDVMDLSHWQKRLQLDVKSLFYLVKGVEKECREAAEKGGACIIAATGMGGSFATGLLQIDQQFFPGQGGIAGFLKTVALEWPSVRVKAVDLNLGESMADLANHLLVEITSDDHVVEVGYNCSQRVTLKPTIALLDKQGPQILNIDSSWVIFVTGGARGITADVACELAQRYQPTLILTGRSALPAPEESPETIGLNTPAELKAVLISKMRGKDESFSLSQVEGAYNRLLKEREIRSNMLVMRSAGAKVHYFQADVRDEKAFGKLIDEIYNKYGRLDGVIHGAGIIEDKFIADKTPESFDRVFDTKADSGFILSRRLQPDSLKFLVFFTSVAGRFGNQGQCDYAAANEVLNKLAVYLDNRWPGRVVSINWGPWAKSGMVTGELQKRFIEQGIELVPRSIGPKKLDQEIRYGRKGEVEVILGGIRWTAKSEDHTALSSRVFPLITHNSEVRRETKGAIEITKTLDPSKDLYLRDHRMDGKPVLPAAMAMELMAEVAARARPEFEVAEISDFRVLKGIVIQNTTKSVGIVAKSRYNSPELQRMDVTILSIDNPGKVHYSATVELARTLRASNVLSPQSIKERRPFPMTVQEAYHKWLFHGPMLQGIREIQGVGIDGIQARLTPSYPHQCLSDISEGSWLIDPVIIDSGFQLVVIWARMYWDMTPLPSQCKFYRRQGHLAGKEIGCQISILPSSRGNIIHFDISFFDTKGRLLGFIDDMEGTCSKSLNRLALKESDSA